ncbi:MAG: hypothetical protein JO092_07285 [Candidatus Eremiobacteraeota bacterium]|nr:hypothetical protein [Candidatus Eremiobacteraeota bacterium]
MAGRGDRVGPSAPFDRSVMGRALRVAGYAALLAWLTFALRYVFDPRTMFAPYGDIGVDVNTLGAIGSYMTSLTNALAALGWQPWADTQQFYYLPMGAEVLDLPSQLLLRDPFKAIKLVYVIQFSIAFFAAAALYDKLTPRSNWRWFAALVYAIIPLTSLQTRLTPFGWIVALMPAALLTNLWLYRRFGDRAAAATGVVCALASSILNVEYLFFVGLPLLGLSLILVRRNGMRAGPAFAAIALAAFMVMPAYTVIATIFGNHLMTWLSPNQATSSQLTLYAQGIFDQFAGILKEAIVSADPAFNATASVPFALFAGAFVWVLVAVSLVTIVAGKSWRAWAGVAAIAVVCFLLSFGPTLPVLGIPLWNAVATVPILQALRTPDRFEQINALLTSVAAAFGASYLVRRWRYGFVVSAICVVAITAGYVTFNVREHVLALQSVDDRVPDYAPVTSLVERIGGRTAVFGFPLHGSQYDWAPYAPTSPRVVFGWDLAGRYGNGDGGIALLRRAAVRSVVTTPNWTRVSEAGIPADLADLAERSVFSKALGRFAHGVSAFDIQGRPMLASVIPLCAYAGPAAFEMAAGLRALETDALAHGSDTRCPQVLFADYDPLDAVLPTAAIASWNGAAAFGSSTPLPLPNVFVVDRFGIATPWYRNAYRGDSLLADRPYLTYGYASATLDFNAPRAGRYAVYVRTSGLATLQTSDFAGRQIVGESRRTDGFAWVALPLGVSKAGRHVLPLELIDAPEADMPAVVDSIVVAPIGELTSELRPALTFVSMRAFEPPVAVRSYQQLFPRPYSGAVTARGQNVALGSGTHIGLFGGELRVVVTGRMGHARFHWDGPTGRYVVATTGWFNEGAPTMTLETRGQTLKIRYDPSIGIAQSTGYARMDLAHGEPIDVTLDARPGGTAALTKIIAMPIQPEETPTSYDDSGEIWEFGKADPLQFYEAIHSSDVAIASGAIRAFPGVTAELPFDPVFVRGRVTGDVQVGGGKGTAELRCGAQSDRSDIGSGSENPGGAALVVERTQDVPCVLRVQWSSETMTLESVVVHARGTMLANWSAQQYFVGGSYRWTGSRSVDLLVDGRNWPAQTSLALRSGQHLLTLRRAPGAMPPLLFRRAGGPQPPPPPKIELQERSATSWDVRTPAPTTLELAQFDDGNWFARTSSQTTFGYRCDLVNTCFDVDAGDVYVSRRLPPILALGLTITLLDVALAIALLFLPELAALWWRTIAQRSSAKAGLR